jgi:hypothetical protein
MDVALQRGTEPSPSGGARRGKADKTQLIPIPLHRHHSTQENLRMASFNDVGIQFPGSRFTPDSRAIPAQPGRCGPAAGKKALRSLWPVRNPSKVPRGPFYFAVSAIAKLP